MLSRVTSCFLVSISVGEGIDVTFVGHARVVAVEAVTLSRRVSTSTRSERDVL